MEGPCTILTVTENFYYSNTNLAKGDEYFYRVYPVELLNNPNLIKSAADYAAAAWFPLLYSPLEAGFFDTTDRAREVAVSGSYAYVADYGDGLRIIYIFNPSAPTETGFVDTTGTTSGIAVSGSYVYVADGDDRLRIIDLWSGN